MPVRSTAMRAVTLSLSIAASFAHAGDLRKRETTPSNAQKDCTPINGRLGYYGNPWCDTGSYRVEDLRFPRSADDPRRFATEAQKR